MADVLIKQELKPENGAIRKMKTMVSMLTRIISVSDLSRGKASVMINSVAKDHEHYFVVKNNKPVAVVIPVDDYIAFNETMEDMELFTIANNRMKNCSSDEEISHEDVLNMLDITKSDLEKTEVELEL